MSAKFIFENIPKKKYNVVPVGITKKGNWYLYSGDIGKIADGSWEFDTGNKRAFISPDAGIKGLIVPEENGFSTIKIDVIIPMLHGRNGEDGTVQGLAQMAAIPIVGCGMTAAVMCMDKVATNTMLLSNGINNPNFYWFYMYDFEKNPQKCLNNIEAKIHKYPMFVKPSRDGSSVGITKAHDRHELEKAVYTAAKSDGKILVEEAISGQEIECAVLGDKEPIVSTPGEILPSKEFYDYDDKYINGTAKAVIPANLPVEVAENVQQIALAAYKIMGCENLARVDLFVESGTNKIYVNEINTMPGFTSISMYPMMLKYDGRSSVEIVESLIKLALKKVLANSSIKKNTK
jgi:D-alanine-D-alanine ligase